MGPILGKRKRQIRTDSRSQSPSASSGSESVDNQDLQDIFRRHFEARFKSLEGPPRHQTDNTVADESVSEKETDWDGFDAGAEEGGVQVIEHSSIPEPISLSKAEAKAFMTSKPPSTGAKPQITKTTLANKVEDDGTEKLNLKNDLALQRLINESHLLDPSTSKHSSGQRQKILDMRLQSLGSKSSILAQEKMPMSHRKGIVAKAKDKESRRRLEAKENGIILERAVSVKKPEGKRIRGVTGPAVGKFKGGTLKLSRKDVVDIKGPKRRGARRS